MTPSFVVEILEPTGERADAALLKALAQPGERAVSRRRLKESFRRGDVRLNGRAISPSDTLGPGRVELEIHDLDVLLILARARASSRGAFLPIVYEDTRLLVLHKHSGVPSVPHSESESDDTAVGAALAHVSGLPFTEGRELEPGLLHRLDTGTSGLLIFAKTPEEWARLRAEWRSGAVRKFYRAISSSPGKLKLPLVIDTPLAHDAKSAKRMLALIPGQPRASRGKPMEAHTEVLEARTIADGRRDLLIRIDTGVMHQIRCHLASRDHPIDGDPIYGGVSDRRLWLHAWKIELPLASGTRLALESALPADWPKDRNATPVAKWL